MKLRGLVNTVLPTKIYTIRDRDWNPVGEIAASTAHEALLEAIIDWGDHCRTAVISSVKMEGVRRMRY